jgi:hypothetical protein
MIGTVVGATMIVVLTAFFPQDRIAFLGLLAVWSGICAFVATEQALRRRSSLPTTSARPADRIQTSSCWRSRAPA